MANWHSSIKRPRQISPSSTSSEDSSPPTRFQCSSSSSPRSPMKKQRKEFKTSNKGSVIARCSDRLAPAGPTSFTPPNLGWCTDQITLARRTKEIERAKEKPVYARYLEAVPLRKGRTWDAQVRNWKRSLYKIAPDEPSDNVKKAVKDGNFMNVPVVASVLNAPTTEVLAYSSSTNLDILVKTEVEDGEIVEDEDFINVPVVANQDELAVSAIPEANTIASMVVKCEPDATQQGEDTALSAPTTSPSPPNMDIIVKKEVEDEEFVTPAIPEANGMASVAVKIESDDTQQGEDRALNATTTEVLASPSPIILDIIVKKEVEDEDFKNVPVVAKLHELAVPAIPEANVMASTAVKCEPDATIQIEDSRMKAETTGVLAT